jgi:hypothetical protein
VQQWGSAKGSIGQGVRGEVSDGLRASEDGQTILVQAGAGAVEGEVEQHLDIAVDLPPFEVAGPPVERVESESFAEKESSVRRAAKPAQGDRFQVSGAKVVGVAAQGAFQVAESIVPAAPGGVDLGERMKAGRLPSMVPSCLIERGVGVRKKLRRGLRGRPRLLAKTETKLIVGLAVDGVRIAGSRARDAGTEMRLGGIELAAAQVPAAEGKMSPGITPIPPQCLAPVVLREARGVAVLLEMQTDEVKFVIAANLRRRGRLGGSGRHGMRGMLFWGVGDELAPAGGDPERKILKAEAGRQLR